MRKALAWGVHSFTASGAAAGAGALIAISRGAWQWAVLLMLLALFVDSVDGMLARAVGVTRALPGIDGRRLDDVVDYLNYAIVPAVFLVEAGLLPHWGWAAPIVLASAYGFSQVEAKTEDDFFLGWPSYWNVVAIYAWLLATSPAFNAALVVLFSALIFVPFKYIYPSRLRVWRRTTTVLLIVCTGLVVTATLDPAWARPLPLAELSLVFPAWYLLLSLQLGGFHRRGA